MASKTRSIARQMAHRQMKMDGIQHPNKVIPDLLQHFADIGKKVAGRPTRDSRFSAGWREYAARRVAFCEGSLSTKTKTKRSAKK